MNNLKGDIRRDNRKLIAINDANTKRRHHSTHPVETAQQDKLVALAENKLELQKKYHEARMERDKELYERQIKIVDTQIDGLVYDLYGLGACEKEGG